MLDSALNFAEITRLYEDHFEIVRADTPALLDRVFEIRYQVYCVENPFEDPAQNLGGREMDADDDRAAHVLLVHRKTGEAAGTARVIFPDPTQRRPLPVEHVLDRPGQSLFSRLPVATTGEISRFAVPKVFRRRRGEDRYADVETNARPRAPVLAEQRIMPFITFGLLRGIVGICLQNGLSHITAVMEPPLIRLLSRFGLDFAPIGGIVEYHGLRQPCVASIDDLINRAQEESSSLWLYAKEEVLRYQKPVLNARARPLAEAERQKPLPGLW